MLLLCLVTEMTSANYRCMKEEALEKCTTDNPRVRITKSHNHYKLVLCFNDTCSGDNNNMPDLVWRISCNDVCDICKSLFGQESTSMILHCVYISAGTLMYGNTIIYTIG